MLKKKLSITWVNGIFFYTELVQTNQSSKNQEAH